MILRMLLKVGRTRRIQGRFDKALWIIVTLGIAGVGASAQDQADSKPSIVPNMPGALYTGGEKISFTVKLAQPHSGDPSEKTAVLVIANIDGETVETVPALDLSAKNAYSAVVEPKTAGLGYYTATASLADASGVKTNQATLSFGILPNVALKAADPDSPFGVATHFMRWHRNELPALQAKLGISWFREEIDFRQCAESNRVSPLFTLGERGHLTWLPVIDYIDAGRGVEVKGVWRWDDDLAKLKRTFEIHNGKLHVYESQNEPNNFGNWTKRFKGPASPWLADNWGKPFCDLAKGMKQTLDNVDPQAKLLWPDLDSPAWVQSFASKWDAAPFIDGVAPHPYSLHGQLPEEQEYVRGAKDYLAMLDSHHIPRNIWITELGYTSYKNPEYKKGMVAYHPLTERQQAAWLVRAYLSHLGWGASRIFWYDLMEDGNNDKDSEHRFGLLRHGSLTPKPAAVAYANLINEAKGCKWIAPCNLTESSNACAFVFQSAHSSGPVLAAWVTQGTGEIRVPSSATVEDTFGTPLKPREGMLPLTQSPVYIHGLETEKMNLGERVYIGAH